MRTLFLKNNPHTPPNLTLLIPLVLAISVISCTKENVREATVTGTPTAATESDTTSADIQLKFNQGIEAIGNGDTSKAKKVFEELTNEHPDLAKAYCNLALLNFKDEDYQSASTYLNECISRDSEIAEAYNLKAQLDLVNGKVHQAKENYNKAISLAPEYGIAHYNLALLNDIYLQDLENAIKHYEIYLSLTATKDERTEQWVNHLKGSVQNAQM